MRPNKKIAFYLSGLYEGGAENVMVILANEFANQGYDVDFVLSKAVGGFLKRLAPSVKIVDLMAPNKYLSVFGLVKYFKANGPVAMLSTLHVNNMIAVIAKKIARAKNSKVVIRVATIVSEQKRIFWKKWLEKTALSIVYPWADAIVAVSKIVSSDLVTFLNIPGDRIFPIYNPSITNELLYKSKMELTHPWFQSGEVPVVLGVGRLTIDKGYATLINAFALALSEVDARLVILGDGDQRSPLEDLIKRLGIEERVEIVGFVDNPFNYMANSSVLVLASLWEGLPNVLVEALACGCPVISTDCPGGVREILGDSQYGILVPMEAPEILADKIVQVIRGENVPEFDAGWLDQFKADTIIKKYLDVMS